KENEKELENNSINSFDDCVLAGNPILESYPRQCKNENQIFTENIGNEIEKMDLIQIESPRPNQIINSPLNIVGKARGFWFFEASFPIILKDEKGNIISESFAEAKNDWMTTEFVPFESILEYKINDELKNKKGLLFLKKDNPSGISDNDDFLEIPIIFSE
ncbi:hypothetical protein EOM09_03160, partial [bacterium]|nr:hypothetical protein [bacterium]